MHVVLKPREPMSDPGEVPAPGEPQELTMWFRGAEHDWSEGVLATPVGPNRWRIEESAVCSVRARIGNVVEVEPLPSGDLRLVRVVRRSPYRSFRWLLWRALLDSDDFSAFCRRVEEAGGEWSRIFGGVVVIDVPKDSPLDVKAEIARLSEKYRRFAPGAQADAAPRRPRWKFWQRKR
jgi:hypothetical protein